MPQPTLVSATVLSAFAEWRLVASDKFLVFSSSLVPFTFACVMEFRKLHNKCAKVFHGVTPFLLTLSALASTSQSSLQGAKAICDFGFCNAFLYLLMIDLLPFV